MIVVLMNRVEMFICYTYVLKIFWEFLHHSAMIDESPLFLLVGLNYFCKCSTIVYIFGVYFRLKVSRVVEVGLTFHK